MPSVLERLPAGARVAVIRLRSLGDCVLTTPALRLLKQHRPDLQIAVVVEDRFAALFENNPDVAALLPPRAAALLHFRPQLTLNLHGGTRSMALTAASLAPLRAGFAHHRYASIYNVPNPRAQEIIGEDRTVHTAEHLASAMFFLGVPRTEIPRAFLAAQPARAGKPYAVIHPFASAPEKAWPPTLFLELASALDPLEPVFIGGPADDLGPFSAWPCIQGSLRDTKNLLAGASLFIGNDSGPAHMAAAFGLPVLVFYVVSDAVVWAPWRTTAQTLVGAATLDQALTALGRLKVAA